MFLRPCHGQRFPSKKVILFCFVLFLLLKKKGVKATASVQQADKSFSTDIEELREITE